MALCEQEGNCQSCLTLDGCVWCPQTVLCRSLSAQQSHPTGDCYTGSTEGVCQTGRSYWQKAFFVTATVTIAALTVYTLLVLIYFKLTYKTVRESRRRQSEQSKPTPPQQKVMQQPVVVRASPPEAAQEFISGPRRPNSPIGFPTPIYVPAAVEAPPPIATAQTNINGLPNDLGGRRDAVPVTCQDEIEAAAKEHQEEPPQQRLLSQETDPPTAADHQSKPGTAAISSQSGNISIINGPVTINNATEASDLLTAQLLPQRLASPTTDQTVIQLRTDLANEQKKNRELGDRVQWLQRVATRVESPSQSHPPAKETTIIPEP